MATSGSPFPSALLDRLFHPDKGEPLFKSPDSLRLLSLRNWDDLELALAVLDPMEPEDRRHDLIALLRHRDELSRLAAPQAPLSPFLDTLLYYLLAYWGEAEDMVTLAGMLKHIQQQEPYPFPEAERPSLWLLYYFCGRQQPALLVKTAYHPLLPDYLKNAAVQAMISLYHYEADLRFELRRCLRDYLQPAWKKRTEPPGSVHAAATLLSAWSGKQESSVISSLIRAGYLGVRDANSWYDQLPRRPLPATPTRPPLLLDLARAMQGPSAPKPPPDQAIPS